MAVDDFGGARDLAVSMAALGRVVSFAVRVRACALCGRTMVPASFVACGLAAAAAGIVGIVLFDEFGGALGAEGGVGKLSFVGFL
jgi:hypothetical protein